MLVVKDGVGAEVLLLQHESDLGELCRQLGHFLKAERQLRTDEVATLRDKLEAILLTAAAMQGNTGCRCDIYHSKNTLSTIKEALQKRHMYLHSLRKNEPALNITMRLQPTPFGSDITHCPALPVFHKKKTPAFATASFSKGSLQ